MKDAEGPCPESIMRGAADAMSDTPASIIAGVLTAAKRAGDAVRLDEAAALFRAVADGFEQLATAGRAAAAAMAQAFDAYRDPDVALLIRRKAHGMATDAERWPDQWITVQCAGMLHRSCESDRHLLGCTCDCHRKDHR